MGISTDSLTQPGQLGPENSTSSGLKPYGEGIVSCCERKMTGRVAARIKRTAIETATTTQIHALGRAEARGPEPVLS